MAKQLLLSLLLLFVGVSMQAQKGDVLRFYAELGSGGGLMDMLGGLMGGGGASGQLNVYYSRDNDDQWIYYDTFVQNGYAYFVAPYSGVYQLRFTSPGASVDNFFGFRNPIEAIALIDDDDDANAAVFEKYGGQTVNVSDSSVPDALNILYDADIPTPADTPAGIQPTIQTIDADGTSRYFDLNGRKLQGIPTQKGVYVKNGWKFIIK